MLKRGEKKEEENPFVVDTAAERTLVAMRSDANDGTDSTPYHYCYYRLQVIPNSHDFRCSFLLLCFSPGRIQRTCKKSGNTRQKWMCAYDDWVFNGNSWSTKRFGCVSASLSRREKLFCFGRCVRMNTGAWNYSAREQSVDSTECDLSFVAK